MQISWLALLEKELEPNCSSHKDEGTEYGNSDILDPPEAQSSTL